MRKENYAWLGLVLTVLVVLAGCGMSSPFGKGKKAFQQGNYDEAEKEFSNAIDQGSKKYESHVYLGRIYAIHKDYEKAIAECKKALDMYPGSSNAYVFSIIIYQLNGQPREAEKLWDKASNLPGIGKGAALAPIRPSPSAKGKLRPQQAAYYMEILKGTTSR